MFSIIRVCSCTHLPVYVFAIALRGRDVKRSDKQIGNSIQSLLHSPQQQCLVVTIQTAKKDQD